MTEPSARDFDFSSAFQVGTGVLQCCYCEQELDIPVYMTVLKSEKGTYSYVATKPDVSEIWLHSWTAHGQGEDGS